MRFLKNHDVADFEGLSYGPFYKDVEYALPVDVANLLIKLGVAEDTRTIAKEPSFKEVFKGEVLSGFVEAGKSKGLFPEEKPKVENESALDKAKKALEELSRTVDRLKKLRERSV